MKTIKKLSLVFALALIFTSCDAIKELADIKLKNQKISKDVEITVNAPQLSNGAGIIAAATPFTKTSTVKISESEELEEYLSKIKEITLNKITCKVHGVQSGDVQSLKLTVSPLNIVKTINPVVIDQEIEVPFTDSEFKTVAKQLLDLNELEFKLEGVVNKTPITFYILVTVDADFVVNPLD